MTDKTEEQIAKDKEAVKAMTGAKNAMEAALRRIHALETTLKSVQEQVKHIGGAVAHDNLYLRVWSDSHRDYATLKSKDVFLGFDNTIKAVL